jgi:hypothetical protein
MTFHENPSSRRRVVPCGRTDGQTDMTKLIVAFRNFANPPRKVQYACKIIFQHVSNDKLDFGEVNILSRTTADFKCLQQKKQ